MITQRLRTDLGRSVGVTIATQLVWLNQFTGSQPQLLFLSYIISFCSNVSQNVCLSDFVKTKKRCYRYAPTFAIIFSDHSDPLISCNMTLFRGRGLPNQEELLSFLFNFFGVLKEKKQTKPPILVWYHSNTIQTMCYIRYKCKEEFGCCSFQKHE